MPKTSGDEPKHSHRGKLMKEEKDYLLDYVYMLLPICVSEWKLVVKSTKRILDKASNG